MKLVLSRFLNDGLWFRILSEKILESDYIHFNILYDDNKDISFYSELIDANVEVVNIKNKIFRSGKYISLKINDDIADRVISKSFSFWKNSPLEDLSLSKNSFEILASISHEDQVYALLSADEIISWNIIGYEFS